MRKGHPSAYTTTDEALARTAWMLGAGYVSQNPCKLAALRLLRNYRYDGLAGGLLVPLAAAGYVAVDAEDGMWEVDLRRLTQVAVDPRMQGLSPAGLKILGFDTESASLIASVLTEAGREIDALQNDGPV